MRVSKFLLLASAGSVVANSNTVSLTNGNGPLTIDIDSKTGAYSVKTGSFDAVLTSGDVFVTSKGTVYSVAKGDLTLAEASPLSGKDKAGSYTGYSFTYKASDASFEALIKLYEADSTATKQAVVFAQHFPTELYAGNSTSYDDISTSFPSFNMAAAEGRGVVSFQGDMTGSDTKTSQWLPSSGNSSSVGLCRVTTGFYKLHSSGAHFSAFVPQTRTLRGRKYEEKKDTYCDCTGHGACSHWAYEQADVTAEDCASACDDHTCSCFDFQPSSHGGAQIGEGISGSGPVVLFNQEMKDTLVISAHNNFMVANQKFDEGTLSYGIEQGVQVIPADFSFETVVVLDTAGGVNSAMDSWGDVLLARSGKERYAYRRDPAIQQLGYSTDNGAYYYYQTEPDKNYEDTLLDVKAYADKEKIPYRYILLDSWWYFKGQGGGVATWDARPDIFPNGLANLYEKTGWTGQLHNRYWSTDTNYSKKNGGRYNFVDDGSSVVVPNDQTFWNDLIANKTKNGQKMFMYEQDWLDVEFDRSDWLKNNATAAQLWMTQMNNGCTNSNVTIQMCMSHVRHILQSTEMPAVTNARASGDYHPGSDQWDVGTTSILAHAIGIGPSKDNYWSTAVQNGTHYGPHTAEPRSWLQSAVLTFSNGPVAPSDAVGFSNASLILRASDSTGRLLQPDRPAANIDAVFLNEAGFKDKSGKPLGVDGKLWLTYAVVDGQRYGYLLVPELQSTSAPYSVSTTSLGYDSSSTQLTARLLRAGTGALQSVSATQPLVLQAATADDPELAVLSPILTGGWTLLGELDKWVSVSPQRFSSVSSDASKITTRVSGGAGEVIHVTFAKPDASIVVADCTLSSSGIATITLNKSDDKANCE